MLSRVNKPGTRLRSRGKRRKKFRMGKKKKSIIGIIGMSNDAPIHECEIEKNLSTT